MRQLALAGVTLSMFGLAGCHNDMWIQPKMKPQFQSDFFPDQQANRPLIPHSVARSQYWTDSERYTGYTNNNKIATTFPFKITVEDIKRGQDRYNVYCSPCHGALGNGQGMIALRGLALRRPVGNYHTEKLLKAPVGHFYDVITNGFGTMYSYASRIEPDDRWRIVAYIKALQRSQAAKPEDIDRAKLSPAEQKQIDTVPTPETTEPTTPPANIDVRGTAAPGSTGNSNGNLNGNSNGNLNGAPAHQNENVNPGDNTGSSTRTQNAQPPAGGNETQPAAGGVNGTNR